MSSARNEKNNAGTSGKGEKARLSMVVKLNLHRTGYALGLLISVNILLIVSFIVFLLWQAEADAADLMASPASHEGAVLNYTLEPTRYAELAEIDSGRGKTFWKIFHDYTPLKDYDVRRYAGARLNGNKSDELKSLTYYMAFAEEGITVSYGLGEDLSDFLYWFLGLLIVELLLLVSGASKGSRRIRRILRPLSDMARQTQNLTSAAASAVSAEEMERLRQLAGTISNIDATKLDKRLPVDDSQNELKDLAFAINNMLNRIDEAYRSQVRFVSDASHELRTPISVIRGYANLLDRWGKNDEVTMQEAIDAIKSEAENMKELVEQLLFLARGDSETLQLHLKAFDASELIAEVLKETQMIDASHTFRFKAGEAAPLYADFQLMKQAVRILVDNSIKYTPAKGEIILAAGSIQEQGKTVTHISIQDDGIGIDPQNLPRIFDRFYRSDESRARKTGGSGLGLSIMKWIVDRHGGTIEVISRKDIGTRTTLAFPQNEISENS